MLFQGSPDVDSKRKGLHQTMKRCVGYIIFILIIIGSYTTDAISLTGSGSPLTYISSCQLDFDDDDEPDIALLVETLRNPELIALIKTDKGYDAYVLSKVASNMRLSCHFGKFIKETSAGKGEKERRTHKTPGTYIKLAHPEGSSAAYFWNGSGFTEVWTSD